MTWWYVGAAAVSVGTSLYEGSKQQGIANQQIGLAETQIGKQNYFFEQLKALIADPSSILKTPGYQLGMTGAAHVGAAAGGPNSGKELAGITEFSGSFLTQQEDLLAGLSGVGFNPSTALSGGTTGTSAASASMAELLYGAGYFMNKNPSTPAITPTPAIDPGTTIGNFDGSGNIPEFTSPPPG